MKKLTRVDTQFENPNARASVADSVSLGEAPVASADGPILMQRSYRAAYDSLRLFSLFGIALFVLGTYSAAGDWPFERGDQAATGAAAGQFSQEPKELWRFEIEESGFEVTPVIAKGIAYLGDVDGTFYAVKIADGKLLWKKEFADSGFISAAAVVDGKVFVGDFNGMLRSLAADSGKLLWQYEARGEMYAGPNVHEGRVLVTTEAGELICLAADTGKLQWKFEIEAPLRCWPTIVAGNVFLAGCDSRLHSVDLQTGQETQSFELAGQTGSTPARWQEGMFFGTFGGTFYRIDDLEITWTYEDDSQQESYSAATSDATVVYTSKGKKIYALNPDSGKLEWDASVRMPVESAPIIVGNSVLFGTKRGRLISLELATGKQNWEYEAGGNFLASPAVSDGKLVIANSDGTLYCFGPREESSERD